MRRLGISIYPEKSSSEEIKAYIDQISKLGFSRIFLVFYPLIKVKRKLFKILKISIFMLNQKDLKSL